MVGYTRIFKEAAGTLSVDLNDTSLRSMMGMFNEASANPAVAGPEAKADVSHNSSLLNRLTGGKMEGLALPSGSVKDLNTSVNTSPAIAADAKQANMGLVAEAQHSKALAQSVVEKAQRQVTAAIKEVAQDMQLDTSRALKTFAPTPTSGIADATLAQGSGGVSSAYDALAAMDKYPDKVKNEMASRVAEKLQATSPAPKPATGLESVQDSQPELAPLESQEINWNSFDGPGVEELMSQTPEDHVADMGYDDYIAEREIDLASNQLAIEKPTMGAAYTANDSASGGNGLAEALTQDVQELAPAADATTATLSGDSLASMKMSTLVTPPFDPEAFAALKGALPELQSEPAPSFTAGMSMSAA